MDVRIPGDAVDVGGTDLRAPAQELLKGLNLLPDEGSLKQAAGFSAALEGPPASVALIEAGATAFSKWWAAGAGASLLAVWGSVAKFYQNQDDPSTQRVLLWAASITSAALILAIAYVINADLRGRAAVQVATVSARVALARAVVEGAAGAQPAAARPTSEKAGTAGSSGVVALHWAKALTYPGAPADQEEGWHVLAMAPAADAAKIRYLIVREGQQVWVDAGQLVF